MRSLFFYAPARTSEGDARDALTSARVQNYLAGIPAAKDFLRYHNLAAARQALEACPVELRGWEWKHLNLKCNLHLLSHRPHGDEVTRIAWSPDGRRLASGARDGAVAVWDGEAGMVQRELMSFRTGVTALAWTADGSRLACGAEHVVVVSSGERGIRELRGPGPVVALAWEPSGQRLAAAYQGRSGGAFPADDVGLD